MQQQVERVLDGEELVAIIITGQHAATGISFHTPPEISQQVATMHHPAGHLIPPHVHLPVRREVANTQEVLVVLRGRLRVELFSRARTSLGSRELGGGDVIVLVSGGHGFEVLEDVEIVEVKQGPYAGEADKEHFAP